MFLCKKLSCLDKKGALSIKHHPPTVPNPRQTKRASRPTTTTPRWWIAMTETAIGGLPSVLLRTLSGYCSAVSGRSVVIFSLPIRLHKGTVTFECTEKDQGASA